MEPSVKEHAEGLKKINEQLQKEMDERKKIEERVPSNGAFLKCIFEGISDGLSVLDTELKIFASIIVWKICIPTACPLRGRNATRFTKKGIRRVPGVRLSLPSRQVSLIVRSFHIPQRRGQPDGSIFPHIP